MKIEGLNLNSNAIDKKKNIPSSNSIYIPEPIVQLTDIRSSQILLPDNKIYCTSGRPSDFNSKNLSIQLPKNYKKVDSKNQNPLLLDAKDLYKKSSVEQYKNTQTNSNIIRISNNIFNEQSVLDSSEVTEIVIGKSNVATKYIKDYEHNTETEIKISNPLNKKTRTNDEITTIHKDKSGKIFKTERYTKSQVPGIYNITETDNKGNVSVISNAVKNDDGSFSIEKNMTSLDGTKTHYVFEQDANGTHKKMFCQISDSNGNALSTIDRTYDKIDEKITLSSVNGNQFKAEKKDGKLIITNYTKNEVTEMKASDFNSSDDTKFLAKNMGAKGTFTDENVVEQLFDTLPADTLITMKNNIKEVIPIQDDLDSAFAGVFDFLMCKTDNFVINHELGHSMDAPRIADDANLMKTKAKDILAPNPQFRKAYVEEKAAFIKEFPDFDEKFISYFIFSPEKKTNRGRKETVAESNAINGLQPAGPEILAMRTTLLQRYFPRSIAALTNLMNPIAVLNNQNQQ